MPEQITLAPARREPQDVGTRFIWVGVALVPATVLALTLLVFWLFPKAITDRTLHLPLPRYPAPQLQPSPRQDMADFYREEMRALNSTGWVDKAHGILHIPIADAMREVADEGIPGCPAPSGKRP